MHAIVFSIISMMNKVEYNTYTKMNLSTVK